MTSAFTTIFGIMAGRTTPPQEDRSWQQANHLTFGPYGWKNGKMEAHPFLEDVTIKPDWTDYNKGPGQSRNPKGPGQSRNPKGPGQSRNPKASKEVTVSALADTGAQMLVLGPRLLAEMGVKETELLPCTTKIVAANSAGMDVIGCIPLQVYMKGQEDLHTRQLGYVARNADKLFLNKAALRDLGALPKYFPKAGMFTNAEEIGECTVQDQGNPNKPGRPCGCPERELPPAKPEEMPFEPTETNIPKLQHGS